MPPKLTPLEKSLGSVMGILYAIGRRLVTQNNISSKKSLDLVDSKYLIKGAGLSPSVRDIMSPEAKRAVSVRIQEGKTDEEIAQELSTDNTFLNSITNIFTPSYLGVFPRTPEQVEEEEKQPLPTPDQRRRVYLEELEEEKKKFQAYKEELEAEDRKQAEQQAEADRLQLEFKRIEEEDRRTALIMPSGLDVFQGIPTGEEKEKLRKAEEKAKKKNEAKANKPPTNKALLGEIKEAVIISAEQSRLRNASMAEEVGGARSNISAFSATSAELGGRLLEGVEEIKAETREIKANTAEIMDRIRQNPRLNRIRNEIEQKIFMIPTTPNTGLQGILEEKDIKTIIASMPDSPTADILAPAVRGLLGADLKMNDVVSGLIGLAVAGIATPDAGLIVARVSSRLMEKYDIDLDKYVRYEIELDELEDLVKKQDITIDDLKRGGIKPLPEDTSDSDESKINILYRYAQRLRPPTLAAIHTGAGAATTMASITAGLTTGRFGGAVSGIIPGMIGGAAAGAITTPLVEGYYRERGIPITNEIKKKIEYISLLPPALVGAYLGYTPPGSEVMGTGVVSGAGITERKLIASPDVIAQTKAQEDQIGSKNKIWQPKTISPTTDILNESKQERYADDLEFIAFNYIAPTSEGGYGTVETNPLKRSQATADAIRYTDAGVTIPYMLWNQINNPIDMNPKQLEKLALGVELPPMEFMAQDNEETFENVAMRQFPNNELMAIEFLSPYAEFSNVDNFWMTNPDNMLFTINA